jgi:hypothetical protein
VSFPFEGRERHERLIQRDKQLLKELIEASSRIGSREPPSRIRVNKRKYRIRFENETENEVEIVIEKRED